MKRRKFLGMLGLAPVVPALLSVAPAKPKEFWAGTTVPRNTPWNPADPFKMFRRVEIIDYPEIGHAEVLARGWIAKTDADAMGLTECPDDVIRLSDLLWRNMTQERKEIIAAKFGCKILRLPEPLLA